MLKTTPSWPAAVRAAKSGNDALLTACVAAAGGDPRIVPAMLAALTVADELSTIEKRGSAEECEAAEKACVEGFEGNATILERQKLHDARQAAWLRWQQAIIASRALRCLQVYFPELLFANRNSDKRLGVSDPPRPMLNNGLLPAAVANAILAAGGNPAEIYDRNWLDLFKSRAEVEVKRPPRRRLSDMLREKKQAAKAGQQAVTYRTTREETVSP